MTSIISAVVETNSQDTWLAIIGHVVSLGVSPVNLYQPLVSTLFCILEPDMTSHQVGLNLPSVDRLCDKKNKCQLNRHTILLKILNELICYLLK